MSHSKRNTTRAFFTAHERAELKGQWGASSTRLSRESFLPFASCNLCLIQARDPVACPAEGHLFCRECAVSNLLAQTKDIKRAQKEAKRRETEIAEQAHAEAAAAQDKDVISFEQLQSGNLKRTRGDDLAPSKRGKSHDSSFWIPSQSGETVVEPLKVKKARPMCPIKTERVHDFALKSLVSVRFHSDGEVLSCPSCDKNLSNSTKGILAKACGHVLCKSCSDKFQSDLDEPSCYVCQIGIAIDGSKIVGLITLQSDATGFAGTGNNKVQRAGLAFQFG